MAVDDVINAAKEKLEAMLAPIDGGAGADISFEEPFEKVKAEIEKMTSMAGGKVDWATIASSCDELLSDKGKDFRAALYYATARSQMDGVAGLFDGFVLLSELIENFWTTMGPPLKRPKARGNLCTWFGDLVGPTIASYQPTGNERDLINALEKVSRRVDGELADKLGDAYGGMGGLRSSISNLVRALPPDDTEAKAKAKAEAEARAKAEAEARAKAEAEAEARRAQLEAERAARAAAGVAEPAPEPAPVQQVVQVVGGGLSPDSVVDVDSANNALGEVSRILQRIGGVLRGADASEPNGYRLLCAGSWIEVQQAPPAENNATLIPSPPGHYKDQLEGLAGSGDWQNLAGVAQEMIVEAPLWLDPHRYASQALTQLGFENARLALLREVGYLLARAQGLADLTFNDGTPFADQATKDWIEAEVKPVLGGGGGGGGAPRARGIQGKLDEARQMVANGALPDAVQLIMKAAAATASQSPAERFRGRLAVAQICLAGEQYLVARAQLDGLDKQVEQHRLWEWEPELCTQFYAALYQAHRGMNAVLGEMATPEQRAKETAAFDRLCQLDAGAALKFTLGG